MVIVVVETVELEDAFKQIVQKITWTPYVTRLGCPGQQGLMEN